MTSANSLDAQALSMVLALLSPQELGKAQVVCRLWFDTATHPEVRRRSFLRHWRLNDCRGTARQKHFMETIALASFVMLHHVQRTDTLQMLAVRYGVDVTTIKRVNNLMSDHSLHSRQHLYIPVANRCELEDQTVTFQHCPLAARDFAVLTGQPVQQHAEGKPVSHNMRLQIDALRAKLSLWLGRSLHIDEATAKYYLEDANGDVKAAMTAFEKDLDWESRTAGPIRTVPVQRWIEGEAGW
eukprot:jgi/Chrzof1/13125/Cz07g20230.t1